MRRRSGWDKDFLRRASADLGAGFWWYYSKQGELPMQITLRPEHERLVSEALRSGAYESPEEVIKRALELLRDRDAWLAENRARIQEGYAAAQRGELMDGDEVRAQMAERKHAWLAEQRKA
jgi:antitoxin ParD1/3/4